MTEPLNGTRFRLDRLEKDVEKLERRVEEVKVEVLIERLEHMEERVDFLIKTLWTTFGSLLVVCFTFLWATAQGWIGA